ncbi:MAG: hypothetical protein B0W54_10335 [Cellvibrio sp. 79]|nr:MAG: hypothetical protein B0W54_10335 [Cellvibrio sp. 79]
MRYSIKERLHHLMKKRTPSKNEAEILRTKVWLENILQTHGVERKELSRLIDMKGGESTRTVSRWFKGTHAAKQKQVNEIAKIFEGSELTYELPVFRLLMNKPIRKAELTKIVTPYISKIAGLQCWVFPDPCHPENKDLPFPPCFIYDTETLIERGDIFGFTAIIYLVRLAETERNALHHMQYIQCAYRALPGLCRHPLFAKYWEVSLNCLKSIHYREMTSILLVRPIDSIIEKQIFSPEHITRRLLRPRDPETHRFTELETPYELAEFQ